MEALPGLAWIAKPDRTVTRANQRWFGYTGLSAEDARDWPASALDPEDLDRYNRAWKVAREGDNEHEIEVRCRRQDGAHRWLLIRASPVQGRAGAVNSWFVTATDIH